MRKLLFLGLFMAAVSMMSCGNKTSSNSNVDTITVDCSADNMSGIKTINICDIRYIEELRDTGFEEIERKDIATFK